MASSSSYDRFVALWRRGALNEALALAEQESLRRQDRDVFWLTRQAAALSRLGRHDRALAVCDQALRVEPRNPYALLSRAEALFGKGRPNEALPGFLEALPHAKTAGRARHGILDCLLALKEWPRALALLAEWNLSESEASFWKVKALVGLGRRVEAIQVCQTWLKLQPNQATALWALADLEIERDGLEAVRERFAKLARIPSRPPIYAEIHASLCRRSGRLAEAADQYARIGSAGIHPRLQRKEAFAMAKAGRETEAIPLLEELLRADPRDLYLHSAYQAACQRTKTLERAHQFYQELLRLHPDEKTLYGRIRRVARKI